MKSYNFKQIIDSAKQQIAIDLACNRQDFDTENNIIVEYSKLDGRRHFTQDNYFIKIASFGNNAVISANSKILDYCHLFFSNKKGIEYFEHPIMSEIDKTLYSFNEKLNVVHELYLPNPEYVNTNYLNSNIELIEQENIKHLYSFDGFRNALQYNEAALRPDILAAVIFEKNKPLGIACASKDSENMWQIGIDVVPDAQKKSIGTDLVKKLTNEILNRGYIPYYGTWSANIGSRKIAYNCGYIPSWVEMYSIKINNLTTAST